MEIEHRCWRPDRYHEGIAGSRIAISGYSHYSNEGDDAELTNLVVARVVSGESRYAFFTSVARAFGFEPSAFWPRVIFFNFVPSIVGSSADKFAVAGELENERARARVRRLLDEHAPDKLFVFSEKAWAAFPKTDGERAGLIAKGALVKSGTYTTRSGKKVLAAGGRHPQGASANELREFARSI